MTDAAAPVPGRPAADQGAPPLDDRPADLEVQIPKILRFGLHASVALMLLGLAAAALLGGNIEAPLRIRDVPGALAAADPRGLMGAGIFLLVLTPLGRVAASILHFSRAGDRLYVGLTVLVAANLALAAWLGTQ